MADEGAPRRRQPAKRVTVTLDAQHVQQLQDLADRRRVSLAWMVRDAVDQYLSPGLLFQDHPR